MMADPKFQAEMRRYTSSPAYKTAMSRASEDIEVFAVNASFFNQRYFLICFDNIFLILFARTCRRILPD